MQSFNRIIFDSLHAGTPLVLVTVITQEGSAPRTAGARMLVLPDASIRGTVGGGRYEADSINAAMNLHRQAAQSRAANAGQTQAGQMQPGPAQSGQTQSGPAQSGPAQPGQAQPGQLLKFSLRGVTDMDMVCGGALTLLLEYLPATPDFTDMFARACAAEDQGMPLAFVSQFSGEDILNVTRALFRPGKNEAAPANLPPALADIWPQTPAERANALTRYIEEQGNNYLLEYFPAPWRLYIFGGGHVSLEVANLAGSIDFQCAVLDDRPEFAAPERFPTARALLLPSLLQEDAAAFLAAEGLGPQDGVIIVTRGHAHDRDVLAALLLDNAQSTVTRPGYIGMIGSKSKKAAVYAALRQSGAPNNTPNEAPNEVLNRMPNKTLDEALEAVHSPIGLSIGAETPREIAVSIVAELIQWRSGKGQNSKGPNNKDLGGKNPEAGHRNGKGEK